MADKKESKTPTAGSQANSTKNRLADLKRRWQAIAEKRLVGRTIIAVRWMTDDECDSYGWESAAVILLLDNGTRIWPSADDEGNYAGALFGIAHSDDEFQLPVID